MGRGQDANVGTAGCEYCDGNSTLVAYVTLFSSALFDSSYALSHNLLQSLLVACDLMEALIVVGFVFLLRMSKALDPAVRVSQAPRAQSA